MSETVDFRGTRYTVGDGIEPVLLPDFLPTVLPAGWEEHPPAYGWDRDYNRVYQRHGTLRVLISAARYNDGKRWLHVSVSRKNREIPTWTIMCEVEDLFIGPERIALQLHPLRSQYVNIHSGVLHLWHPLDGVDLPDFTGHGETI